MTSTEPARAATGPAAAEAPAPEATTTEPTAAEPAGPAAAEKRDGDDGQVGDRVNLGHGLLTKAILGADGQHPVLDRVVEVELTQHQLQRLLQGDAVEVEVDHRGALVLRLGHILNRRAVDI